MAASGLILDKAWAKQEEIRKFRELLHQHPELAWEEHQTTEFIGNQLADLGVDARVSNTGTGLIAEIGPTAGDVILLRSDIDALKIPEENNVPYRSRHAERMHACGHDVTASGLVYAAGFLKEYHEDKGLPNKIRFVWQPAEEGGNGGAERMITEDGVLQDVEAAFGLHCWTDYHAGEYATREGPTQYSHLLMEAEFEGKRGHSARPNTSSNLGLVGPKIQIEMDQEFEELHAGDDQPPIVGWTGSKFLSDAANATPSNGMIRATVRSPTVAAHQESRDQFTEMFNRKLVEYKLGGSLNLSLDIPPVVNTPWATQQVNRVLAAEVGRDAIKEFPGSTGGDDMAYYGTGVPGIKGAPELHYTQLGIVPRGRETEGYPGLHTSKFDVDPRAPMYAAVHYTALGAAGLSGHPGQGGRGRERELSK